MDLDLKDHGFEGSRRARLRLLGHNEGDDARRLEVEGKKTREENQIQDDPKRIAAKSSASAAHLAMGSYAL